MDEGISIHVPGWRVSRGCPQAAGHHPRKQSITKTQSRLNIISSSLLGHYIRRAKPVERHPGLPTDLLERLQDALLPIGHDYLRLPQDTAPLRSRLPMVWQGFLKQIFRESIPHNGGWGIGQRLQPKAHIMEEQGKPELGFGDPRILPANTTAQELSTRSLIS